MWLVKILFICTFFLKSFYILAETHNVDLAMIPNSVDSSENKNIKAFWKSIFRTNAFTDKSTTNTIVSTEIYGKLQWKLVNSMSFHAKALAMGKNGFTQSIYDRSDRNTGLHILEAFFEWNSMDMFLKIGNIQQSFLEAPLLITDRTFPSVLFRFPLTSTEQSKKLFFLFQGAIPDNASEVVRRETQIVRGAPLFATSSIFFQSSDFLSNSTVKDIFTLYYYYNISPAVADRSRVYGNTIERTGNDSSFRFQFLGLHNHLKWQKQIADLWLLELGIEYLYNFLAPDTYNEGGRFYGALYHNYENLMELKFTGEIFSNQSDTSIAYYNSEIYGHNNRRGVSARVQSHLFSSGLTIGVSTVYSQPINNPEQSPTGSAFSVSVFLLTNYVTI